MSDEPEQLRLTAYAMREQLRIALGAYDPSYDGRIEANKRLPRRWNTDRVQNMRAVAERFDNLIAASPDDAPPVRVLTELLIGASGWVTMGALVTDHIGRFYVRLSAVISPAETNSHNVRMTRLQVTTFAARIHNRPNMPSIENADVREVAQSYGRIVRVAWALSDEY